MGHIVSLEGIATHQGKIEAIIKWPTQRTVTDVRSFLGFASYNRQFVSKFAQLARPLHLVSHWVTVHQERMSP